MKTGYIHDKLVASRLRQLARRGEHIIRMDGRWFVRAGEISETDLKELCGDITQLGNDWNREGKDMVAVPFIDLFKGGWIWHIYLSSEKDFIPPRAEL